MCSITPRERRQPVGTDRAPMASNGSSPVVIIVAPAGWSSVPVPTRGRIDQDLSSRSSAPPADAEPRVAQFFPATIAGENRATRTRHGHDRGMGRARRTTAGKARSPERQAALYRRPARRGHDRHAARRHDPHVPRSKGDRRRLGSRNRYLRVYSGVRTEKQNAFIEFFLRSFPSTLH